MTLIAVIRRTYGRKEQAQDNRAVMLAIPFCLRYTLPLCHG